MKNKFQIILLLIIISTPLCVFTQDLTNDHKIFTTVSTTWEIKKNKEINIVYTGIGELQSFKYNYFDLEAQWKQKLSKRSAISYGSNWIRILQNGDNSFKNYLKLSCEYGIEKRVRFLDLNHSFEAEYYIPKFNKFQFRFSYELAVQSHKTFSKWRIRPFSKFKLYYYGNGKLLNYYDDQGELLARKSPNDIHRWRWTTGFKFRPIKGIYCTLGYLWNEEFNAGIFKNSNINIYNKDKTAIRYPYNSYGAIQLVVHKSFNTKKYFKKNEAEHNM